MANKILNSLIQLRNDTAQAWTTANPTLLAGEFGIESDTRKIKVGDGSTAWKDLGYVAGGEAADLLAQITALENKVGNESKGLVKDVADLKAALSGEGDEGEGLVADVEDLKEALEDVYTKSETYAKTEVYNKSEIDAKVASAFHYKSSVNGYNDLPTSGQQIGDVYNVATADTTHGIKAGDNVVWDGEKWDVLAGTVDLSAYMTKAELEDKYITEEDIEDTYATKEETNALVKDVQINGISAKNGQTVNIPLATATAVGLVKGSTGVNAVAVAADGTMSVTAIGIGILDQTDGTKLVLNCGGAAQ